MKIIKVITLATVVLLAGCEKDSFTEDLGICPIVAFTNPADSDINVFLNQQITITFNEAMNPSTISDKSILIRGTTEVVGTVSYNGVEANFKPSLPLSVNTTYVGTVKSSVRDVDGNALQEDYTWTFSTGQSVSPMVITTDPSDNQTNVSISQAVSASFSMPMNASTIDETTFTLTKGTSPVLGTVAYNGITATFTPNIALELDALYTATITAGAKNIAGTSIQVDYIWSFRTAVNASPVVDSSDPIPNETKVAINKVITATFNEPMDQTTIDGLSFTIKEGVTSIAGVVTYNGLTATFAPNLNLELDKIYTATITTAAKNLLGTPLDVNHNWIFSTKTSPAPAIDLNSVGRFGIIAGVGVSNDAGFSVISNLDVGIYPGVRSSITGFLTIDGGPGIIVNGNFFAADDAAPIPAMLLQAKSDLTAAYLAAEGATLPAPTAVAGDIGGQTLAPGIYKSTSTLLIQNGNLTLDAQNDPTAVWIFQVASDFTTVGSSPFPSAAGGNIILIGGAKASNVFWQVGSSATLGDYTSFKGNILALTTITMNAYSQAEGRMLCSNGAITLTSTNMITKP
jgi:hypothetical protein